MEGCKGCPITNDFVEQKSWVNFKINAPFCCPAFVEDFILFRRMRSGGTWNYPSVNSISPHFTSVNRGPENLFFSHVTRLSYRDIYRTPFTRIFETMFRSMVPMISTKARGPSLYIEIYVMGSEVLYYLTSEENLKWVSKKIGQESWIMVGFFLGGRREGREG